MRALPIMPLLLGVMVANTAFAQEFPGSGRLKFKKGPVCMCDKGLNENDIQAAEEVREQRSREGVLNGFIQNESSRKAERRRDEEK
ncbi:MAG: hypothetical protein R6X15_01945 [Pseudomonadota bacterium]